MAGPVRIARPYTRQPLRPGPINPRLRGVVDVWTGSSFEQTLIKRYTTSLAGTVAKTVGARGNSVTVTGGLGNSLRIGNDINELYPVGAGKATVAVLFRWTDTTQDASFRAIIGSNESNAARGPHFYTYDSLMYFDYGNATDGAGGGKSYFTYTSYLDGNWHAWVCVADNIARGREVWRDGVRLNSQTDRTATIPEVAQGLFIGNSAAGTAEDCEVALTVFSNVDWSEQEIRAWSNDPYGVTFAPRQIWMPGWAIEASTIPVLSAAAATNIAQTTADLQVTITFS